MERMRILHIVESLDRGAVENWLVSVFVESRKSRPHWEWTFYCLESKPGKLDHLVERNGGVIIRSPVTISRKLSFLRHLRKALKEGGYDVLHAHHDFLSGFYLLAASGIPFRRRILHIHNNDRHLPIGSLRLRRMFLPILRWISLMMVDKVIAISEHTRDDYRRGYPREKPLFDVLYYGIDMERFVGVTDARMIREGLNIPEKARFLLYVGRMNVEKNPMFTLDILHAILARGVDAYLVLVGKGDKETDIRERAMRLGVEDRVRMLGWIESVHELMKTADAFVFPRCEHPPEGLGLVVVEAQCAGLPMFITQGIVADAIVIPELAHRTPPLDPDAWVDCIERVLDSPTSVSRESALARMRSSPFNLSTATANLMGHYI